MSWILEGFLSPEFRSGPQRHRQRLGGWGTHSCWWRSRRHWRRTERRWRGTSSWRIMLGVTMWSDMTYFGYVEMLICDICMSGMPNIYTHTQSISSVSHLFLSLFEIFTREIGSVSDVFIQMMKCHKNYSFVVKSIFFCCVKSMFS